MDELHQRPSNGYPTLHRKAASGLNREPQDQAKEEDLIYNAPKKEASNPIEDD
jgi:hypothetical protein